MTVADRAQLKSAADKGWESLRDTNRIEGFARSEDKQRNKEINSESCRKSVKISGERLTWMARSHATGRGAGLSPRRSGRF